MNPDVLGSRSSTVFIADREGNRLIREVTPTSLTWSRSLNAPSYAEATFSASNCGPFDAIGYPWGHSLVIFRGAERAWSGPIRRRVETQNTLTLRASDVLGWLDRRPIRTAHVVTGSAVRTELEWAVSHGFASDDPDVTAYLQTLGGLGGVCDVEVYPGERYAGDVMAGLVANGGRYTTLDRSIILWTSDYEPARLRELVPAKHLQAAVEVVQDGDELVTEAWARNDDGIVSAAEAAGGRVDSFYGHVGVVTGSPSTRPAGVARTAAALASRAYPCPVQVSIPADSVLRPDAPFPLSRLVPGVTWPVVADTVTRKAVSTIGVLAGITVKAEAGVPETVSVTVTTGGVEE